MPRLASRRLPALLLGIAAGPLGHLLAYQVRYGAQAAHEQSTGAHSYFPALLGTVGAGLGGVLLAILLALAAVRLLIGRHRGLRARPERGVLQLVPVLFTVQIAVFVVQEHAEELAAGAAADPAPTLLLWGTLGQLPVAVLGALTLSWLSAHLDAALERLDAAAASFRPRFSTAVRTWMSVSATHAALDASLRAHGKRGPPRTLELLIS